MPGSWISSNTSHSPGAANGAAGGSGIATTATIPALPAAADLPCHNPLQDRPEFRITDGREALPHHGPVAAGKRGKRGVEEWRLWSVRTGEGKLADRARELGQKGHDQELPPSALEALREAEQAAREAARSLKEGDAERGLSKQREAQQRLEAAKDALGDQEPEQGEDGDRHRASEHADIPKADQHKGPEEFRKRVVKGLSQPSGGRFRDAVKRYADGLLR